MSQQCLAANELMQMAAANDTQANGFKLTNIFRHWYAI